MKKRNDIYGKKAALKAKIITGILAFSVITGLGIEPANVYAATAATTSKTILAKDINEAPLSFTERIHKILEEMYQVKNTTATKPEIFPVIKNDASKQDAPETENASQALPAVSTVKQEILPQVMPKQVALAEGTYNFDWKGTPLSQSLYSVAKVANRGVVVNGSLTGQVYMSLQNVTCNQALDYLSSAFNFNWMTDDNSGTIIISTSELMKQSKEFYVNYIDKEKLKDEIVSLGIAENNIYANSETGTVSVTGTPYQIAAAERKINSLDKPVSQCLLVAQLIEISHGNSIDLGMKYSLPTYTHTGQDDSSTSTLKGNWIEKLTFSASTAASKELSKGKVIARPMVMVKNGEIGTAEFGNQVPVLSQTSTTASTSITVEYKNVGTNLKIKPIINANTGDISLNIDAEVSNIARWVTSGETTAPQISTRKTSTSAHLKSGQSFVIGGLMNVNELDNLSGIPGLMDLPILGKLFSYHSKEKTYAEVYIMITPYIVSDTLDAQELLRKVEE